MSNLSTIADLRSQGKTWAQIGRIVGCSATAARSRHQRGVHRDVRPAGDEFAIDHKAGGPVDLDTLFRIYKLVKADWEVVSLKVNRWEVGAKVDNVVISKPLYQTKATLRPARKNAVDLARTLLKDITHHPTFRPLTTMPKIIKASLALEVCPFDLHIGKLSWAPETGETYDLKIAEAVVRDVFARLWNDVGANPRFDEIILPLGNDYYHYDNLVGSTTALTPQDRDSRFHKMFRVGAVLASFMIQQAKHLGLRVIVPIVPGNHDQQTMFTLGEVLTAEFANDRQVTIDNGPKLRKYHKYGRNLIGFTHGKWEKPHQLAALMANEVPDLWAQTVCREYHTGHLHHEKRLDVAQSREFQGVRIRTLPALCAIDNFHATRDYVGSVKEMQAFVWRKEGGLRQQLFVQPDAKLYA